jgi:carbonic anhydrase
MAYFPTSAQLLHFLYRVSLWLFVGLTTLAFANDDPHAAPAKPAAPVVAVSQPNHEAVSPKPPAMPSKEIKEAKKEAKEAKETKETKPNSTPDEVAVKIAERLAKLRVEHAEKSARQRSVRKSSYASKPVVPTSASMESQNFVKPINTHWSYGGESGPLQWAEMNPEWAKCGSGNRQSPIDIRSGIKVDLEPINFDYKPSGFNIIDNGHTIQVNLGSGNYITVANHVYELVQFHFHRPSEERVNGRTYEMVVHLVHKDVSGKLAVVAILIERGAARSLIQTIWNNLPLEKNETVTPTGVLDMNTILPKRRDYFTYMGSLTTPPCSEGVLWMVMKEPVSVSQDQIEIFARLYQMNARPIQSASERMIKESN